MFNFLAILATVGASRSIRSVSLIRENTLCQYSALDIFWYDQFRIDSNRPPADMGLVSVRFSESQLPSTVDKILLEYLSVIGNGNIFGVSSSALKTYHFEPMYGRPRPACFSQYIVECTVE